MITLIVKAALAYLLGSLIGSLLVGRLRGGVDIRRLGSGNAGGTNALRTQGKAFAFWVLLIDIGHPPLLDEGTQRLALEPAETLSDFIDDRRRHDVAREGDARAGQIGRGQTHGRDTLPQRFAEGRIEPDADDDTGGTRRLGAQLEQDPAELASGHQDVIGPLQPPLQSRSAQRTQQAHPDGQPQRTEIRGRFPKAPAL